MKFSETDLQGVWIVETEPIEDERGFLMRTYCEEEFAARGLNTSWPQTNQTLTRQAGALRGLHYQADPESEIKLIRCTSGKVWDCLVDIREDSPSRGKWISVELSPESNLSLYVPEGIAHGFQCLTPDCGMFYMMSRPYAPKLARGIRWNDPGLGIDWPLEPTTISERDRSLPSFDELS